MSRSSIGTLFLHQTWLTLKLLRDGFSAVHLGFRSTPVSFKSTFKATFLGNSLTFSSQTASNRCLCSADCTQAFGFSSGCEPWETELAGQKFAKRTATWNHLVLDLRALSGFGCPIFGISSFPCNSLHLNPFRTPFQSTRTDNIQPSSIQTSGYIKSIFRKPIQTNFNGGLHQGRSLLP
jgi:hypothetical protein